MGDGVLLEFPSVVAAVECVIAIQQQMAERNADVPDARRILYRIGVDLGDVLIDGEDILGDGVNIAARLEGICEPGAICISGSAYDHVRGRIDADLEARAHAAMSPSLASYVAGGSGDERTQEANVAAFRHILGCLPPVLAGRRCTSATRPPAAARRTRAATAAASAFRRGCGLRLAGLPALPGI